MLYGNFEKLVTLVTLSGLISPTALEFCSLLEGRKNLIQNFTGTLVVPDETGTKIFLTHTCKKLKKLCYTDPDSLNGLSR